MANFIIDKSEKTSTTREFLLFEIGGSCKKRLPEKILSHAQDTFLCKSIVISCRQNVDGQRDYLVGLRTQKASKNTYAKKGKNLFQEMDFKIFKASTKKGLGAWARALCAESFEILFCSGEFNKTEVMGLAQQSKKKRKLATSQELAPNNKSKLATSQELAPNKSKLATSQELAPKKRNNRKKKRSLSKKTSPLFFFLRKSFFFFYSITKTIVETVLMTTLKRLISLTIYFFLYIYYIYKGGNQLTQEILAQLPQEDILHLLLDWLLDWRTPGLPPEFSIQQQEASFLKKSFNYFIEKASFLDGVLSLTERLSGRLGRLCAQVYYLLFR